jgi:hypothetical protein
LAYEFIPVRAVLLGSGVELSEDNSLGIKLCDVGDLTFKSLMWGGDSAIGINHNFLFLSALKLTEVSFDAIILSCFEPFVSAF